MNASSRRDSPMPAFFWDRDLQVQRWSLIACELKQMSCFRKQLGSLHDKSARVAELACGGLADDSLGADESNRATCGGTGQDRPANRDGR